MVKADLKAGIVIDLMKQHRGNVRVIAERLGICRQTLYNYINETPSVKAAMQDARESLLDDVESVLYDKALAGDAWAVQFFLRTQGRARGYVERTEVTGADSGPIQIEIVRTDGKARSLPDSG